MVFPECFLVVFVAIIGKHRKKTRSRGRQGNHAVCDNSVSAEALVPLLELPQGSLSENVQPLGWQLVVVQKVLQIAASAEGASLDIPEVRAARALLRSLGPRLGSGGRAAWNN